MCDRLAHLPQLPSFFSGHIHVFLNMFFKQDTFQVSMFLVLSLSLETTRAYIGIIPAIESATGQHAIKC